MPSKNELGREVNEKLGTDLEFSRMTKDDLEEFHELIDSGELLERLMREKIKDRGESALDSIVDGWEPGAAARRVL